MNRIVALFMDRLTERFTAIVAAMISSRVESLQATTQAEQQSQLEDLARQYELDGKSGIAGTLRGRAERLTSSDLAGDAVGVLEQVTRESPRLSAVGPESRDARALPNVPAASKSRGGKRRSSKKAAPADEANPGTMEFPS